MTPKIKICGIKTEEEIKLINKYPVTYIGFIAAKSKRQITIEKAAHLRSLVRSDIQVVGVFMDQPLSFIQRAIEHCHFDLVQLHGNETNEMIKAIQVPVWKSVAIKDRTSLNQIKDYPDAKGLLLDTYHKGATGGTGRRFNWELIKDLKVKQELILAGGLSGENVLEAIEEVHPDVLDLNSGLETDLIKDPIKVRQLFDRIT